MKGKGVCADAMKNRPFRQRLAEWIAVVMILAVFLLIVLPWHSGPGKQQSPMFQARTKISSFGTALEAYRVDMGNYPRHYFCPFVFRGISADFIDGWLCHTGDD